MSVPSPLPRCARLVRAAPLLLLAAAAIALSACNVTSRLANVGRPPPLTHIENPTAQPDYVPVSLPMPAPQPAERQLNSLWRSGARAFFKDQRAAQVGDILTVVIDINDQAQWRNETTRGRENSENLGLPNFFGYENKEDSQFRILPKQPPWSLAELLDISSTTSNRGTGAINRSETLELKVAALVTQVLPNGNLVIQGRQEVRVNYEVRELQIAGVIRPEDITSANTISYEKIAEARIAYGGRGQITDVQQPRYGQQIFDIILPF